MCEAAESSTSTISVCQLPIPRNSLDGRYHGMIVPDSLTAWIAHYEGLAVTGVRSASVAAKIHLQLQRFCLFFVSCYGQPQSKGSAIRRYGGLLETADPTG